MAPWFLVATALVSAWGHAAPPAAGELRGQLDQLTRQLKLAQDNIFLVEKQYADVQQASDEQLLERRFGDGEIQYLLQDYPGAAAIFYDLVTDRTYAANRHYAEALNDLSDALYQMGNFIGARMYFKELVSLRGAHYREALERFIELSGRLNEFSGIDEYINEAKGPTGTLPPEVAYVYGKWLFKRLDLPLDERMRRAEEAFAPMAHDATSPFRLRSAYYVGVCHVEAGEYDKAIEVFTALTKEHADNERDTKVRELASLSLGRVFYEAGKYDEAIDRYRDIQQDQSEYFAEALYETAWAQVKKNEYEKAKNATEILKLVADRSTLEPDAKILYGHLLLKLKKYQDATEAYNEVINEYAPVRDEVNALLSVHKDPVSYFDDLLARNEKTLDVNSLLPPVALKWASTQHDVTKAVAIVNDLEGGRKGVGEGQEIAHRILETLDKRGLEAFPALQEGYTRAAAVSSALTQVNEGLTRLEHAWVDDQLSPQERTELNAIRAQKTDMAQRFSKLPTTQAEVETRRQALQAKIDELDKLAFQLGLELQSGSAQLNAVQKWVADNKSAGKWTPEDQKAFESRLQQELETIHDQEKEVDEVRRGLAAEKHTADTSVSGEDAIRAQYAALLNREHELLASAEQHVGPDGREALRQAHDLRAQMGELDKRVDAAKASLRDQVGKRGQVIREKIRGEQSLLEGYGKQVGGVSGEARQLVGRIAYDSFKRVYQQFYELVLKADVGIVDVAFTRKQDETLEIQKLSAQKDKELKLLDDEFKDVLKDVDSP